MKWNGHEILFASQDGSRELKLAANTLADISFACALPGDDSVVLTAAAVPADMADVSANKRGNYRAYVLDMSGLRQLTNEYTNSAIPLRADAIAYSNGRGLVVMSGQQRTEHKVGRFNWGPPSISSNANGTLVAMVRWKGDDRKLLIADVETGQSTSPAFSLFSYVLLENTVFYALSTSIKAFEPRARHSWTVTDLPFRRRLLQLCDLSSSNAASLEFRFSDLGLLGGHLVTLVWIVEPHTYVRHASVVLRLSAELAPAEILFAVPPDAEWRLNHLAFISGTAVRARMQRFDQNLALVETKFSLLGAPSPLSPDDGWSYVASPQAADFGFQFLPRHATH